MTEELNAGRKRIAVVVLAAGGSQRMGQPKLLMPVLGQPMVRRVVQTVKAAGLDSAGQTQIIVVVGSGAEAVRRALDGLLVEIVENPRWSLGLSTSLRLGLLALKPDTEAVLLVLADQPALTRELVRALVERFYATGAPIVAPSYKGRRGNPVLFRRHLFPELLAVEGDEGGREVITRHRGDLQSVEIDDPLLLKDVDTVQDYESLRDLYDHSP